MEQQLRGFLDHYNIRIESPGNDFGFQGALFANRDRLLARPLHSGITFQQASVALGQAPVFSGVPESDKQWHFAVDFLSHHCRQYMGAYMVCMGQDAFTVATRRRSTYISNYARRSSRNAAAMNPPRTPPRGQH